MASAFAWRGRIDAVLIAGAMLGGMAGLSVIHMAGAWLFVAFVITHMYLTTTGEKPLSNIKAMIVGYEDVEQQDSESVTALAGEAGGQAASDTPGSQNTVT